MFTNPKPGLSTTQKTMLDLALACDLKVSDSTQHDAIRSRHKGIQHQQDAAAYIREVEGKVHSRRKFPAHPKSLRGPGVAAGKAGGAPAKPDGHSHFLSAGATTFAIAFLVVLTVAAGWAAPAGLNLILVILSILVTLIVLGVSTTGRPLGILINERNLMSLSRFQTAVWTVIVLGAFLTFALARIKAGVADALSIQVDENLWILLGISTASLVGSPLILSTKKDQTPSPAATQRAAQMVNEPVADVNANRRGTLYANAKLSDARLTDMFEGDEVSDTARLDLAKVQMFYFTIIAAISFLVLVFNQIRTEQPAGDVSYLSHLPVLSSGFVALLGISHAGYLGSKTVGRTQSQVQP